jgi:hypothetical protein
MRFLGLGVADPFPEGQHDLDVSAGSGLPSYRLYPPGRARCEYQLQLRQTRGYLWREAANASILTLVRGGIPIKQIAKRTGHSRKVVRNAARSLTSDIVRTLPLLPDRNKPSSAIVNVLRRRFPHRTRRSRDEKLDYRRSTGHSCRIPQNICLRFSPKLGTRWKRIRDNRSGQCPVTLIIWRALI